MTQAEAQAPTWPAGLQAVAGLADHDFTPEAVASLAAMPMTPEEAARIRRTFADAIAAADQFLSIAVGKPADGEDVVRLSHQIKAAKIVGKLRAGLEAVMAAKGWA